VINWLLKNSIVFILCIKVLPLQGQNLLGNGSFETMIACPNDHDQLAKAIDWISVLGSPDLMASCTSNPNISVPNNMSGTMQAYDGLNYAHFGIIVFESSFGFSEMFSCKLLAPLQKGNRYCLKFQIALADSSAFAMNKIGIAFTEGLPPNQLLPYDLPRQFESPDSVLLDNSAEWTTISGFFTADNNANYITIGQFNRKQNVNVVRVRNSNNVFMTYYIDDIQINQCAEMPEFSIPNIFTPNDDMVNDLLTISIAKAQTASTQIMNRWGTIVFESTDLNPVWDGTFNGQPVADGVYFVVVQASGSGDTQKTETQTVHLIR
jgi:gliding motility-associated-like protein